jgi:hypothetical protein
MKTTLFVLFFLFCVASAFGQVASAISSQPSGVVMAEHPLHASQHEMRQEESLLGTTPYTYAQGEQPLWQFPSDKRVTPLGDIARAYRKEHETAKRAEIIWEND